MGLLTETEKQVHLWQLHMRPIQWHLKNNWRVPESLEKVIHSQVLLWRILTWCTRRLVTLKAQTHHRPAECDRQTIQTRPNHSTRMVPSPRGFPSHMLPVAPAPSGLVCHQVQQQTARVCVTGSRPPGMGSECTQSVLGRSGPIYLPTNSHLG